MADLTDVPVQQILARQQVIEAVDELFMATDRKDWEAVRAVLAPELVFDMSSAGGGPAATLKGAEVAGLWERGLARIQEIHHQAGNHRVTVEGTTARATCYAVAWHYRPGVPGGNTRVFVGSYEYELEYMDERWRITLFRYHLKFIDGNTALDADG
jgi:hypothetical protein